MWLIRLVFCVVFFYSVCFLSSDTGNSLPAIACVSIVLSSLPFRFSLTFVYSNTFFYNTRHINESTNMKHQHIDIQH